MAKTDWQHHCAAFLREQDTSAAARRSYCDANGLNANSFRRELASFAPQDKGSPAKQPAAKKSNPKSKQTAPDTQKGNAAASVKKSSKDTPMVKSAAKGKGPGTTRIPKTQILINTRPNVATRSDGTRTFTKGNTAAMKHGGYSAVLSEMDLEIQPDDIDLLDIGRLLKARLLGMSKIRRDRINGVVEMYERGNKMTRVVIGHDGAEIHEPLTLIEALESVEFSGIDSFSNLTKQLVAIEEKVVSMERMRRDTNALSKSEAIEITAGLLMRRNSEGLTAMETCHLFSSAGLEPPKLLMLEAEKELQALEPDPGSQQGVTEEELAQARVQAWSNRENDAAELAARQKWLDEVLAQSGQTGEVRVTVSDDAADDEDELSDDDIQFLDDDE